MTAIDFIKMNALGNDFVVVDTANVKCSSKLAIALADRAQGIGCDQVLALASSNVADIKMLIYNSDGSHADMCGNGLRCIGKYMMRENKTSSATVEINGRTFLVRKEGELIAANIGRPMFEWDKIPLAKPNDTLHMNYSCEGHSDPTIVNVGNPHMIFFITTPVVEVDLTKIGPLIEKDKMFPEGINITFAEIIDTNSFRLRVWERGAGETAACGSSACATAAAAFARGLTTSRTINLIFRAGRLSVNILQDDSLEMIGDATIEYNGKFDWVL